MMPGSSRRYIGLAAAVAAGGAALAWLDARYAWITPAFDAVAHQFYEVPLVARLRRPSQLVLARWHLAILVTLVALVLFSGPRLSRAARAFLAIFVLGYALRAVIWVCGGNLPLVPGDSCHYLEVTTSVLQGEGPVKHYVESFFRDYPRIREGRGVLDDWATPLDAYVRAFSFRALGLTASSALDARLAAAKACSFVVNLLALPALYVFARRRYDARVALWSMAALAVLPVHAIYAGFILRESLVALTAILAVWTLTEVWNENPPKSGKRRESEAEAVFTLTEVWNGSRSVRAAWGWAFVAGVCGGLAILARTTGVVVLGAAGIFGLVAHGRRHFGPLLLWAAVATVIILPWAWVSLEEYGSPFYSYTHYFEFNFSWTVHHFDKGNTLASQFYTMANLPEIVRVKAKSLLIIVVYSTMIVGLPVIVGFAAGLADSEARGHGTGVLIATILAAFGAATLKSIADVTQVAQLGRYYLPVFALSLPPAVAAILDRLDRWRIDGRIARWLAAGYCALLWADPTWAYDASWLVKRYQLHWPALAETGEWIRAHPDQVPPDARIMTWFPWELRVTSDRTTILLPRNYSLRRIQEVIQQYRVTHLLWGSFEPPPYFEINPEAWSHELGQLQSGLGLTDSRELFRSRGDIFFPVRLYRLR
jgi:hypothetical protein